MPGYQGPIRNGHDRRWEAYAFEYRPLHPRQQRRSFLFDRRDSPNYHAAEDIPKTAKAREYVVKLTVCCTSKNTLEREVLFEDTGQIVRSKIMPVDEDRIRVESSTPAASGIHVRE